MGAFSGVACTLLIQAYGRRKVAKAVGAVRPPAETENSEIRILHERLRVLEQIITDQPRQLADTIERLR
jgi:hypothetical protein